ncbi:MAG: HAMP domain-containing protein, partial [Chloroflexota bacterium]
MPTRSIGRRLIWIVLGLSFGIVGLIITITLRTSTTVLQEVTRENFQQQHGSIVNLLESNISDLLRRSEELTTTVQGRTRWTNGQVRAFVVELLGGSGTNPEVINVNVYRGEGQQQIFTFDYQEPEDLPTGALFPIFRANDLDNLDTTSWVGQAIIRNPDEPFWHGPQEPLYGTFDGLVMSYAMPLTEPEGLIWIDIPVERFEQQILTLLEADNSAAIDGYTFMMTGDRNIIATINPPTALPLKGDRLPEIVALPEDEHPLRMEEPLSGVGRTYVVADVIAGTRGWLLVQVVPDESLARALPPDALAILTLGTIIGLAILAFTVQRFITQTVSVPLNNLSIAAQEIGSGDLRYQLNYRNREDEIGRLSRALEDMKTNLSNSYQELENFADTLEQRVRKRTRELDIARREALASANELQAVYDESLLVVSAYQLHTILETLVQRIHTLLDASYTAVWLVDHDTESLRL